MQMAYTAIILSMVIAVILLSSSLVSYFTMGSEIVFASSNEGGEGGGDEGSDGGGEGEGNEEQDGGGDEEPSEEPAAGAQEDSPDEQPIPEDQQQLSPEEIQGLEGDQFVLCPESKPYDPRTGKCGNETPQALGGSNEVCDNQKDDDSDGEVDESSCVPAEGQQTDSSAIPPAFSPNPLAGQAGGWGIPQGSVQGVDQGQVGGGTGPASPAPIPSFAPSSSQDGNTPDVTQGPGSSTEPTGSDGGTTGVPSFAPGGSQLNAPGTTQQSDPGDEDEDSGGTGTGGGGSTGQGGSGSSGGSSSGTTTGAGSTGAGTDTGTYTDPNGRFKIGYPPNAKVTPVEEGSPGDKVVTFTAPPPTEFTSIGIEVTDTGEPIDLEGHVNSYLVALETALPGYTLVESPDCVRYTLGGQRACAYIYTVGEQSVPDGSSTPVGQSSNSQGSPKAIMELYSVVGNSLYKISYSTLPNDFNGQLPVAEGMIRSFVLLNTNS